MRTALLLGLSTLALSLACAVQPAEDSEATGDQSAAIQTQTGPTPVTTTVDCTSSADATCYECGNSNGVMCCVGKCTVIKVDAITSARGK